MIVTAELKSELEIAGISLDSAVAYAERIAGHGILQSHGFDLLMESLKAAQTALDRAKMLAAHSQEPVRCLSGEEMVRAALRIEASIAANDTEPRR